MVRMMIRSGDHSLASAPCWRFLLSKTTKPPNRYLREVYLSSLPDLLGW